MQDEGYCLELSNGESITLHGMLVCMCGDTPGTNYIAGFKEGVGFALRKCRMCLATANDILVKVCKLCKLIDLLGVN